MTTENQQMLAQLGALHDDMAQLPAEMRAAHAQALAKFPDNQRTYYVDQQSGDDANDGSNANPFATLQRASNMTPKGGVLRLFLKSNYHVTARESFDQSQVLLADVVNNARAELTFGAAATNEATSMPELSSSEGPSVFTFSGILFRAGTAAGGVIRKGMLRSRGQTFFRLVHCQFDVPAGSDQSLITNDVVCSLFVENANTGIGGMAGRWVQGVASGTNPATQYFIQSTNLTSL